MASTSTYPLPRERALILGVLLALAAVAWLLLLRQSLGMDRAMAMGLTAGMAAPLFLAMWLAMMVAMMFPTAAPMILVFARVAAGRREREQPFVSTWVFVGGYLVVWTLAGVLAYLLAVAGERLADRSMWLMDHAAQFGGLLFVAAGVYQLSPLKDVCLGRCRSPMAFVLHAWRDGAGGALRMGLQHGLFCLGCCWLLFAILFPLGVMNVAAMAAITALIFAEKSWAIGRRVAQAAAVALIAYGIVVALMPDALPSI